MLTRLRISGFKNLADVDVRFGPFTCIAGANGSGKSNLFDAIRFLSLLAERPLLEAARGVRGGFHPSGLFQRLGGETREVMTLAAEMIVPPRARDDLGQEADATITFLAYRLTLGRREDDTGAPLMILHEELRHIPRGEAHKYLYFKHSAGRWRRSVIVGERRAPYLISTAGAGPERVIQLHQDGGGRGGPLRYDATRLPRTVLSGTGAAESPTAFLARHEMRSWRLLQLEPSALRKSDDLTAPPHLGPNGSHLAATLDRLTRREKGGELYRELGERLSRLVHDVRGLRVDRDESRGLLTLWVTDREGAEHPASALSDGSLRFLALAALALDSEYHGTVALEEPENGIHPERIPAILGLLQDVAVNPARESGPENPLRQVIVNTHSPALVSLVPEESLLVALAKEKRDEHLGRYHRVEFHPLPGTWRAEVPGSREPVPFAELLAFLHPPVTRGTSRSRGETRVGESDELQQLLIPFQESRHG